MAIKALKFPVVAENKTAQVFKQIKGDIGGITGKLMGMKSAVAGLIGVASFGIMARNVLQTADQIHKLNLRLGITPEALSELRHAADLSGVSFKSLTLGMQRATRRIAEAAQGTGTAKSALEELGLKASDLVRMKPEAQLEVIADAMQGVEGQADKVRLAFKLFDAEGVSMLQMMTQGSEGIRKMREDARDLGLTLSQEDVDAAANFNDSLTDLRSVFEAITTDITIGIAPALTTAAEKMVDWYKANRDIIKQNAGAVFDRLKTTFDVLWPIAKTTAEWFYKIADGIAKAAAAVVVWAERNRGASMHASAADYQARQQAPAGGGPLPGSAAAVAAAGGGAGFTGADAEAWAFGQGGGATIVNNFNGQYSRNDVANIAADQALLENRQ